MGTRNTAFLKSSDTFFRADKTIYSLGDGSLKLTSQQLSMGSDAHGDYDVITNYYTAGNANVSTSFIIYQDVDVVVFNQVSKNKQHSRPHIEFAKIIRPELVVVRVPICDILDVSQWSQGNQSKHV